MRVLFLGTGAFAVPTFQALLASHHEIVAVVTMPLRNVREKKTLSAPVREVAQLRGIQTFDPENVNDALFLPVLSACNADLLFVCDYGKILSPAVIASAKQGGINLHGSLLPKYRGAAPINHALLNGEPSVGVSVIHITPELDAGPIVGRSESLTVESSDTAVEIEQKLADIGAKLVMQVLSHMGAGTLTPILQSKESATKAPKLKKTDGEIDWVRSAQQIFWQYQALQPWPKIFTTWHRSDGKEPMRLILGTLEIAMSSNQTLAPGKIFFAEQEGLFVGTGAGQLQILSLQPAGKKMMDVASFVCGHSIRAGDTFARE